MAIGRKRGEIRNGKKLLHKGMEIEEIMEITELTKEEIEKL